MTPRSSILPLVVACLAMLKCAPAPTQAQNATSPLWFDLEPGPHPVGFTTRWVMDRTREYGDAPARPIRMLVWFPAVRGTGSPMRYGDYLEIAPSDDRFRDYGAALAAYDRRTARRQFSPPSDSLLGMVEPLVVAARRDARPGTGPFPLVIHSLGLGDYQLESTVLWEFLASHGYAVAVVPQMGMAPGARLGFDEPRMRTQVLDIAAVRAAMIESPWVDNERLGIVGHSYGGLAALVYADHTPDVDVVVTLDGSAVTERGIALVREANWTFAAARAPVLNLFRATAPPRDLSVFDRLSHVERYHVTLGDTAAPRRATHFDFQNWPLFSQLVGVPDPRGESRRPGSVGVAFYLAACRLTRGFLDHALEGDRTVTEAMRRGTAIAGVSQEMIRVRYAAAER